MGGGESVSPFRILRIGFETASVIPSALGRSVHRFNASFSLPLINRFKGVVVVVPWVSWVSDLSAYQRAILPLDNPISQLKIIVLISWESNIIHIFIEFSLLKKRYNPVG